MSKPERCDLTKLTNEKEDMNITENTRKEQTSGDHETKKKKKPEKKPCFQQSKQKWLHEVRLRSCRESVRGVVLLLIIILFVCQNEVSERASKKKKNVDNMLFLTRLPMKLLSLKVVC